MLKILTKTLLIAVFLLSLFVFPKMFGQSKSTNSANQKVDEFIVSEKERLKIPGLSLLILKDGKIIKESHLGYANLELKTPVNKHSAFSIASMSKTYTAAAILLLAERGKLRLDDRIRKYFPEAPETWQEITLGQLVSHTSGLVDDWTLNNDWENTDKSIFNIARTNKDFLERLYKTPLLFKPGTSFKYACGTFILGMVIEKISGKSYSEFMHKELFKPLGLNETWVDDSTKIIPYRVSGYLFENKKLQNGYKVSDLTLARGDVSIRTSARDIAKWLTKIKGEKLLNRKSRELMFRRASLNDKSIIPYSYGGWFVYDLRGNTTYDHGGNYRTGFSSHMMEFADDGLIIILLTNLADTPRLTTVQKIASFYNPAYRFIKDLPVSKEPVNAPTEKFEKILKTVGRKKFDRTLLSETFPKSFYGESFARWTKELKKITYLTHRDVSHRKKRIFGKSLKRIWFYRIDADKIRYIAFYESSAGKVIFIEYPES